MKSILNLLDPGALSEGSDLTTASILALEKGSTRIERSGWFVKCEAKSKLIKVKLLMPNLSLKDSQIKLALSL